MLLVNPMWFKFSYLCLVIVLCASHTHIFQVKDEENFFPLWFVLLPTFGYLKNSEFVIKFTLNWPETPDIYP
jgi:hypothetical protein